MKIAFFSRSQSERLDQLVSYAGSLGAQCVVNPCQCDQIDVAVSFGGDGTFLSVSRKVENFDIPILGINNGRLGFLASCPLPEAQNAIVKLINHDFGIENRKMISVQGLGIALNEFSIQKRDSSMVNISITVDNNPSYSFWADGVIVSTPTGSTAYSLSVGGAIVAPDSDCFIISPIAPHNLNVRPLVVGGNSNIKIDVKTRDESFATATLDNQQFDAQNGQRFNIAKSLQQLKIIRLEGDSFYKTLRDKLSWAIDPRL